MKKLGLVLAFVLTLVATGSTQGNGLLIDDFEGNIFGGADGTVDFGAGNGSDLKVSAAKDIKYAGNQSLKAEYDAVAGGYMYIAKGSGLDAKKAEWLLAGDKIDWKKYNAIAIYVYGTDSKTKIAVDLKDSGNELWRYTFEDNFKGWKQVVCPFASFMARDDWQPDNADKNITMDFPIKSYQFEPLPVAKGALYFDSVELINK